jgi:hypothetical protein
VAALGILVCAGATATLVFFVTRQRPIPAAQWTVFAPPDSGCAVLTPGTPVAKPWNVPGLDGRQYLVELPGQDTVFILGYFDRPQGAVGPDDLVRMAKAGRDGMLKTGHGTVAYESAGPLLLPTNAGPRSVPGHECHVQLPQSKGMVIQRIYAVDRPTATRVYLVTAGGPDIKPDSGDGARFLNSFSVNAKEMIAPEPGGNTPPAAGGLPGAPAQPVRKSALPPPRRPLRPVPPLVLQPERSVQLTANQTTHALLFTPDGKTLIAGAEGETDLWDAADLRPTGALKGHRGSVVGLGLTRDGTILLTAAAVDPMARLWDLAGRKQVRSFKDPISPMGSAQKPNGLAVATSSLGVRVWEGATDSPRELTGTTGWVEALAFAPDGRLLAAGDHDMNVSLWDCATWELLGKLKGGGPVTAVAFSPDGKLLASAGVDQTVILWDVQARRRWATLKGHTDPVTCLAFSPDGKLLVSGAGSTTYAQGHKGEMKVWEVATAQERAVCRGHTDGVSAVAFGPSGKVVSAAADQTMKRWDVTALTAAPGSR